MSLAFTPNFFLTRVGDDLVLHRGQPRTGASGIRKKRVLVIGGGVTGFTVCSISFE